jgi:hypothetical protein
LAGGGFAEELAGAVGEPGRAGGDDETCFSLKYLIQYNQIPGRLVELAGNCQKLTIYPSLEKRIRIS